MYTLQEAIQQAQAQKNAIGHFNIANLEMLKAIWLAAQELSQSGGRKIPIIIGVSEGERDYIGVRQSVALIKSLREEYDYPIFISADHTASVERSKEAIDAGFDSVIIDCAKLPLEENIANSKAVVEYAKAQNYTGLVEAELGYIGSGSTVLEKLPEGAAITQEAVTKVSEAVQFVAQTGIDLFAPAVGNVHGMLAQGKNPNLFIDRIKAIAEATQKPLVLHGGSGISDDDFTKAVDAGISIIHISTELRAAWRAAVDKGLADKPEEIAPYKLMTPVLPMMIEVVKNRLKLFNKL